MKNLLLLLSLTFVVSCGVEIGNPNDDDNDSSKDEIKKELVADSAVYQIGLLSCQKMAECFPDQYNEKVCFQSIPSVEGYEIALGLGSTYRTAKDIHQAQLNRSLEVSYLYLGACLESISTLTCDSEVLIETEELINTNSSLNSLYRLINTESSPCQKVYK